MSEVSWYCGGCLCEVDPENMDKHVCEPAIPEKWVGLDVSMRYIEYIEVENEKLRKENESLRVTNSVTMDSNIQLSSSNKAAWELVLKLTESKDSEQVKDNYI